MAQHSTMPGFAAATRGGVHGTNVGISGSVSSSSASGCSCLSAVSIALCDGLKMLGCNPR
eukprot:4553487-Amphidinium_carterae.1